MRTPTGDSYWILEGALLAGKYPGARTEAAARLKIEALLQGGVRTFVDLTEVDELLPYAHLLPSGVRHRRIAVPDVTCPAADQIEDALDLIDQALRDGIVYLHCRGGCGRTGVIVGCHFVRHGSPPEQALERVHELTRNLWDKPCPETSDQVRMVHSWTHRH
jgi:protein-tyrosine phosphatase